MNQFHNSINSPIISDPIYDSKIHRYNGESKNSAWYVGHELEDGKKLLIYGDWVTGEQHIYKEGKEFFTVSDEKKIKEKLQNVEYQQDELQKQQIVFTQEYLKNCQNYFIPCEYVNKKKIKVFDGLKTQIEGNDIALIVPTQDVDGNIWGFQKIFSDGTKLFLYGQRIKGTFFKFGELKDEAYLCEGVATGASIYQAINKCVICCFNAGNLPNVANDLRLKYPNLKIYVCADNDQYKEKNTGIEYAKKIQSSEIFYPEFKDKETKPTDFNDLHLLEGIEEVKKQLCKYSKLTYTMLPEPLQAFIVQGMALVQCPLEYIAYPALAAFCACLGPKIRGRPSKNGDHTVPCPIWLMGIGEKGTRKSSSLDYATKYANKIDDEIDDEYKANYSKNKEKIDQLKIDLKKAKKEDVKLIQEIENEINKLTPERDYFILQEMTTAALVDTIENAKNGVLIRSDELSHFLQLFNSEHSATLRGFVLSGWNADQKYKKKLKTENEPKIIKNYSISILGNIQPSAIEFFFDPKNRKTFDDGFLDRFIMFYPDTEPPKKWVPIQKDKAIMAFAEHLYKEAYYMKSRIFDFSQEAEERFKEIDLECQKRGFSALNTYAKGFWYKAPRNIISLATSFCAMDFIEYKGQIDEVNKHHLELAYGLIQHSALQAQKIYKKIVL